MRGKITVGWRGLIAFAIFAAVFGLLIAVGQVGDLLIRALIWTVIVATSALLLVQRFGRERPRSQSKSSALLERWHRWAMDEPTHR